MTMPVPIADSVGYEGTVNEPQWATLIAGAGGRKYGVLDDNAWRANIGSADREVRIGPGSGFGWGVLDRTTADASLILPPASAGSEWHLIAVHRDWQNNESSFDSLPAGSARAIPPRATTHGTTDDQPLWLARIDAGKSQVQELVDLRVWGSDGGSYANDLLVRQYLDRLGTVIRIGAATWARTLDAFGQKTWTAIDSGRLLGVYPLKWVDLPASGSVPGQGIVVWNEQSRVIAEFDLPDPGVPYRVQMFAQGFWGRELESTGARYDFDAMVGGTPIATKLPAGDEFMFSNWRSWSPWPSPQVFTGAQKLGFRARRIFGGGWGACQPSQSIVVASVYSA